MTAPSAGKPPLKTIVLAFASPTHEPGDLLIHYRCYGGLLFATRDQEDQTILTTQFEAPSLSGNDAIDQHFWQ
jgi:hypothetical protein